MIETLRIIITILGAVYFTLLVWDFIDWIKKQQFFKELFCFHKWTYPECCLGHKVCAKCHKII